MALAWIAAALAASVTATAEPSCPTAPLASAHTRPYPIATEGGARWGRISYPYSLPLADHELALTFDDGPSLENTPTVLAILRKHCIKAAFFLVGVEVKLAPALARQIAAEGHTLGVHSQTHPDDIAALPPAQGLAEIDDSIDTLSTAMAPAPPQDRARQARFFRFPKLIESPLLLDHLKAINYASVSVDLTADDWTDITAAEIRTRALDRIEERKRGVLLLHDWSTPMVSILDDLITTLEARGYRFVQLVEAPPNSATSAQPERLKP
jgi:peptidoglycan/xylan/chitin deacetylase (PgdA/CDA1 family)